MTQSKQDKHKLKTDEPVFSAQAQLTAIREAVHQGERFRAVELLTVDDVAGEIVDGVLQIDTEGSSFCLHYILDHQPAWVLSVCLWIQYKRIAAYIGRATSGEHPLHGMEHLVVQSFKASFRRYNDHKLITTRPLTRLEAHVLRIKRAKLFTEAVDRALTEDRERNEEARQIFQVWEGRYIGGRGR